MTRRGGIHASLVRYRLKLLYTVPQNWGGRCTAPPPHFGFRASVNSNYPIHLKIELASCHAFSSSNLHYFFHPKCFSPSLEQFLNRFLKIGAKVFQENQKPDISKCRGCKDPVPMGIMLLGYRTYIPVLGSSWNCVRRDFPTFYISIYIVYIWIYIVYIWIYIEYVNSYVNSM